MPIWRALGGVSAVEPDGVRYLLQHEQPLVIDARGADEFAATSFTGAVNVPLMDVSEALGDGRVPTDDYTIRIVVFGDDGAQARAVAEGLTRAAFINAGYFTGTATEFLDLAR